MKMKKLGALLLAGVMTMSTLLTGCEMVHRKFSRWKMPRRRRVEVMVRERKSQFS